MYTTLNIILYYTHFTLAKSQIKTYMGLTLTEETLDYSILFYLFLIQIYLVPMKLALTLDNILFVLFIVWIKNQCLTQIIWQLCNYKITLTSLYWMKVGTVAAFLKCKSSTFKLVLCEKHSIVFFSVLGNFVS